MDNQLPELKVNMLGRFSITYGEQPITFKRNSATGNQSSKTTADSVTFQSGGGPREHRNPQSTAA